MKIWSQRGVFFIFCISSIITTSLAQAATTDNTDISQKPYWEKFSLDPVIDTYIVSGDKGRFRQDQLFPDNTSGGIGDMKMEGKLKGISYEYEGRDLANYDYLSVLKVEKEDNFSVQVSWKRFRKYWDDLVTPWSPSRYGLPGDFTESNDSKSYTDRTNVDVEVSHPLGNFAKIIYEYHLWQRQGHEVLLGGGFARAAGLPDLGVLPMINTVDGISNTFVVRVPIVINEIHHIEPSFSAEIYHDNQNRQNPSFANGAPDDDDDRFRDADRFVDLKSKVTYESWLKDNIHVNAGYENEFIKNTSARSDIQTADPIFFTSPSVNNWRVSNAVTLGTTILDFLRANKLDLRVGTRAEYATTRAHSTGDSDGINRTADSTLNEGWFGEILSLTYKGIPKTTAFARIDMEQRRLRLEETFDAQSLELFTNPLFGLTDAFPHDLTDITYIDFMPTFRLVHRLNSWIKASASYRFKSRVIDYDYNENTTPNFFEYLGNRIEYVNEAMAKLDMRVSRTWTSSFSYQMQSDNRSSGRAGDVDTQDLDRHRFLVTLSGPVLQRVYLIFSGMYEYNRLDTPTFESGGNNFGTGSKPFSFIGDVYLLSCNANYRITKNINTTLSYQVTGSLGNNRNILNKATAGLEYDINPSTSIEAKYAFYDFLDKRSVNGIDGGFDDYYAHGISLVFKKTFS